jgi:hypothetical protein
MSSHSLKTFTLVFLTFILLGVGIQLTIRPEFPVPSPVIAPIATPEPAASTQPGTPVTTPVPQPPSAQTVFISQSQLTMLSIANGHVFIKKTGTAEWIDAKLGMTLETGDSLKSDTGANAEITFFDGSVLEIQANTMIKIGLLSLASGTRSNTIGIEQTLGKTISRVGKLADPASRYEINTPAGVAAVRGSVMLVEVIEDGTTRVTNIEGDIRCTAQGIEVKVPQGMTCVIYPGQPPALLWTSSGGSGGGRRTVGNPNVEITGAASNDIGMELDPKNHGAWKMESGNLVWDGLRYEIHVATTNVSVGDDKKTLIIDIESAYPGYCGSAGFVIKNTGLVPMQVDSFSADIESPGGGSGSDLLVVLSGVGAPASQVEIGPGGTRLAQLDFNLKQSAVQGGVYRVRVNIVFSQP